MSEVPYGRHTMILTWNPDKYHWDDYADYVVRTGRGETVAASWSTGGRVGGVSIGDRVFLLRQGTQGRGVVGSGIVVGEIYQDDDWEGSDESENYVDFEFDRLVAVSELLPTEVLKQKLPETKWDRLQMSGTFIRGPQVDVLEELWSDHTSASRPKVGQIDATAFRLDTADGALESGWEIESTSQTDEFKRMDVTITVQYSAADDITTIAKASSDGGYETLDRDSDEKRVRLRAWLAGISASGDSQRVLRFHGKAPKLSWSREKWLHKPTQEVLDNSDPRVPQTVAASKKARDWYLIGSQANVEDGYYRRDMDMQTATASEPEYTATWHPRNGPAELLTRGSSGQSYWACVHHHQAKYTG